MTKELYFVDIQRKTLMVEKSDEFDKRRTIRQSFPFQSFPGLLILFL